MTDQQLAIKTENRMAKIETKLDAHCETQLIYEEKNDRSHLRIEEKIDSLPGKVAELIKPKADKDDVTAVNEKVKTLDDRFWGVVVAILVLLAGIVATWFKH